MPIIIKNHKIDWLIAVGSALLFLVLVYAPRTNSQKELPILIKTFGQQDRWGYDLYVSGSLYIHQPNIPAVGGDIGFATEADARKVAELMVGKMRKNIFPPAVTVEDLRGVGIVE